MSETNNVKDSSASAKSTKRIAYSLAAGAAAGLAASQADAEIVYSGTVDLSIAQFTAENINLDGDAYNDILLKNYVFGGGNYQGAYVNFYPGKLVGFTTGFSYASALEMGDVIDVSTTTGSFAASMAYGAANPDAEFNTASDAYIGLAFPIAATNHYGWLRVSIDNAAGTFVVHDWAYNDVPGEGIVAGQVPEPSTLGLLAAGAAGVAAMRRRKKSVA
ncbi:PEP-CTERM sorting domain-containing protein [Aeoliella mucimassa]|uniref:PEP-CTERM motif protein n=1 Tax=Aeoliella mucimassa TaxID=2527972 RepID=A0A518AM84_9BACT|nr:PEP-CTERM sorting domain-containing protein [Aeoliella mucimassa]QDU55824.1 PEP-CTERM motif protein [Aeoliella mucimassa]